MDELQRSSGCQSLTKADGSLLNKQWLEFELTLYNIHSATTWRQWKNDNNFDQGKAWHRIHIAFEKLRMRFRSRPPHWRTILEDWENKCILATKQHRGVQKDTLHQPQNTNSLRDTRDNTTHMFSEGELAVKLHAKNDEVGTCANGSPRQDLVKMGRVHSLGSSNHYSLLFC